MPCLLGDVPFEAAALCAVMKVLAKRDLTASVVADIDWPQAGITEAQFWAWWNEHQIGDARYATRYGY